jgi:hypothetical protein
MHKKKGSNVRGGGDLGDGKDQKTLRPGGDLKSGESFPERIIAVTCD